MHKTLRSLIVAAVVPMSGVAMAADVVRPPPVAPAPIVVAPTAFSWTGHYLGIQGGWETNRATSPGGFAANEDGGLAGLYGGFNFQSNGRLVWGLDASINWDGAKGGDSSVGTSNSAGPTWKGFVRGRVGLALNQVLIYGTGGAAVMGYKANVTGVPSGTATPWGWTAGAGVELALNTHWTIRGDWAYQDYGTFSLSGPAPVGGTSVHVTANTFTGGVAMKF
jgi:outer membrane immunogenic protein